MKVGADTGGTFTDVVTAEGRSTKVLSRPDDPAQAVAAGVALLLGTDLPDPAADPAAEGPSSPGDPGSMAGAAAGPGPGRAGGEAGGPSVAGQARGADAPGDGGGEVSADAEADRSRLAGPRPELLAHGTTVATNALLERRGAAVALVTTRGLGDVIEIARQDRPSLYDQLADRPEPLVPRRWRHEVPGRLAADGREVEPLDPAALAALADTLAGDPDVEAVAVCLLHADLDPRHEQAVAEALRRRGIDVTCSHEVSPEMREYERTVTTVINASLRPRTRHYLRRLAGVADEVLVMTSAGGLLPALEAAELPAALLLSGPAGGVRAGAAAAVANGFPDAVTFDMGGTSTDVCLILDGAPAPAAQRDVGGFTVRFPALDVHTIGAGGGSIARLDPGGALVVGPESAGAEPGPACYGRGGTEPTVTDANLVAGRIPANAAFGGLRLDRAAAEAALSRAGVTAEGVLAVVNANMDRALRAVSVERGVDPRGLALVAFGGAGPLHAAELAEALDMAAVVIPDRAGVLSAVGLLTAPRRRDLVRSWPTPYDPTGLDPALTSLATDATSLLATPTDPATPADPAATDQVPTGSGVASSGDAEWAGPTAASAGTPGTHGHVAGDAGATGGGATGGDARPARLADASTVAEGVAADVPAVDMKHGHETSMTADGTRVLADSTTIELALDCRYRGQSHELTVPVDIDGGSRSGAGTSGWVEAFHAEHERRNGYARRDEVVEVVALRATARRAPAVRFEDLPATERRVTGEVRGPQVLSEPDCTVWIPPGWVATAGAAGALVLRRDDR